MKFKDLEPTYKDYVYLISKGCVFTAKVIPESKKDEILQDLWAWGFVRMTVDWVSGKPVYKLADDTIFRKKIYYKA